MARTNGKTDRKIHRCWRIHCPIKKTCGMSVHDNNPAILRNTATTAYFFTDNQAAEHIATKPTMNEHSRSIDIRHHAVRQDYLEGKFQIRGVKTRKSQRYPNKTRKSPQHKLPSQPHRQSTYGNTYAINHNKVYTKWQLHLHPNHSKPTSTATNIPSDQQLTLD